MCAAVTLAATFGFFLVVTETRAIVPREWPYAIGNLALFSAIAFAMAMLAFLVGVFVFGLGVWPIIKRLRLANWWASALAGGILSGCAGLLMLTSPDADGLAPLFGLILSGAVGGAIYSLNRRSNAAET